MSIFHSSWSDKMQKQIFVLFVDLSAAFDHVVRKWLFKSVYLRILPGTEPTLIKILEALYSKQQQHLLKIQMTYLNWSLAFAKEDQNHYHYTTSTWILSCAFLCTYVKSMAFNFSRWNTEYDQSPQQEMSVLQNIKGDHTLTGLDMLMI